MSNRERRPAKKTSTGKMILICVLVMILIAVGCIQYGDLISGSQQANDHQPGDKQVSRRPQLPVSNTARSAAPGARTTKASRHNSNDSAASPIANMNSIETWPAVSVEDVVQNDPFEYPSELVRMEQTLLAKQRAESLAAELEEKRAAEKAERERILKLVDSLRENGVQMSYIANNRRLAKIDGNFVQAGDIIDGLRILEIKDNGSVVVEAPTWPADPIDPPSE